MRAYLFRRLPSALAVLVLASFAVFLIIRLVPGDPAASLAGTDPSPAAVAAIRHELGLDRPLPAQYGRWIGQLLTGRLGASYTIGGQVGPLIGGGIAATAQLTAAALLLAVLLGSVAGIAGAVSRRRWVQAGLHALTTGALAVPPFVTGVVLVFALAVAVRLLPSGGYQSLFSAPDLAVQYLAMPALCLALPSAAVLARYLRDGLERALREDHVRTATALGVPRRRIVWRHALPGALPPAITVLGLQVGQLLGGAVLVEVVFAWPGLGQLAQQAVQHRDYPVVQDLLLLLVTVFVAVQLLTDAAYAWLDPRIRWSD
jgi:peptide/nickel transport system permease protein